jgi:hypothetical protein
VLFSLTSNEDVGREEEGEDAAHEYPLRGRRRLQRRGGGGLAGGGHRNGNGGRSRTAAARLRGARTFLSLFTVLPFFSSRVDLFSFYFLECSCLDLNTNVFLHPENFLKIKDLFH